MADPLDACCEQALRRWMRKIHDTTASYPVIQDRPCPVCKRIIPVRAYHPPPAGESA